LEPFRQTRIRRIAAPIPAAHRWGVVLAGGDGVRLRKLTRWMYGDDRPKQFCSLLGDHTLLEDTRQRAERSIPAEQVLFSLTRAHEDHYLRYFADRPSQRIVQPLNKGTAPAILSALMRIAQTDAEAIVSILPCDHYYSSESAFTAALESALEIAEQRTESVIVLGAQPTRAETEYGWVEIGEAIGGHSGLFRVKGFQEKPSLPLAEALFLGGSLWNTFVMVGHVNAFLAMARATVPGLMQVLGSMEVRAFPEGEVRIPDAAYRQIALTDFSHSVLELATDSLLALRLNNIEWNDLGDSCRVMAVLFEKHGKLPSRARRSPAGEPMPWAAWAAA
jgi:mannose-1-phosphate guanylyltransferase